jgi:outer membrane protein
MKYFRLLILGFSLILPARAVTQDTLSLQEALVIALDNNFDITLASNDSRIADIENSIGNAGMLPQLGLTGSRSFSVTNTYQKYFDGRERASESNRNNNINGGVALTWTLFDGFNMFIQKKKLSEFEALSDIQLQTTVENTLADVITAYYAIITQKKMVDVYREAMAISSERKRIATAGLRLGSSSELSLLQASVDYNADSSAFIQQAKILQNTKVELNRILCRDIYDQFEVFEDIPIRKDLLFEKLWEAVSVMNPEIRMSRTAMSIAMLDRKSANSTLYPRLNFTSGYNYNKSESEVGIMSINRNRGYNVGVNASYTLFDGFAQKENRSKAQVRLESARIQAEQTELNTRAHLQRIYNDYLTNLQLSDFEQTNVVLAHKNLDIATEKYRIGSANDIELRETQKKLMDAENRYLTALYRCKSSETELLRMSGGLKN